MNKRILFRMKELKTKLVILSAKHVSERQFIIDGNLSYRQTKKVLNNQRIENRVLAKEYADVLFSSTAKVI